MKRLISLLCALCLLFSFAFAEDYATTNPYTIDDIGMTLALPDVLSVTSCDVGETTIDLRLAYNGRNDVSYAVAINYDETLEDYVTISLPEENLQAMIDYYQSMYTGGNPGLVAYDEDDDYAALTPFCAGGKGQKRSNGRRTVMAVYKETIHLHSHGKTPSFFNITDAVK